MSAAKVKMRQKKLRNQPSSVQFVSERVGEEDIPHPNGGGGDGPSDQLPVRKKSSNQQTGWVRGHQKDGGVYADKMPQYITAGVFARARATEVRAMLKAVTKTTGSCQIFGALPKHMRRRAMSHNTKRLPCRLREMANKMREKCLQGSFKKKAHSKNKSRKARRHHGNLLLEFNRRQRKNVWLETHIWHAKRFHMVKKWGYSLGDRPTLKCYRPCYRAMSTHCLLQDLSYYCCLELQGEEDKLLDCLSQLTSKETGPTFAQRLCLSGQRQGSVVLYRAGQFPLKPLGPATFLWRPRTLGTVYRQIWTWVHPILKQDILTEFLSVCQCHEAVVPPSVPYCAEGIFSTDSESKSEINQALGTKRKQSKKDRSGPPPKKILGDGTRSPNTPTTWKSSSTGILINDLTMEIVRYRLIGPQSHSVLADALEAATNCDELSKSQPSCLWWPDHCKDELKMKLHQQQTDIFHLLKGIYSTAELPPGTVLGLTVDDPRLNIPTKKVKVLPCVKEAQEVDDDRRKELSLHGVPEHCCQSFLWQQSVRNNVTDNKMSEQDLNRMRSEVLVPGSRLSPIPPQCRVPILLVHQPGKQEGHEMSSWGAGWDLMLPKGWGMAFWIPLVYRGVRIGGLKMSLTHSQNKGVPHFPHDYPDCPGGACFQEEQESELLEKFKRRPPAKRINYIKHGCLAPFGCPWQQLAEEWDVIGSDGEEKKGDIQAKSTLQGNKAIQSEIMSHHEVPATNPQTHFTVLRKSLRLLSSWCRPTSCKGQRLYGVREMTPLDHAAKMSFQARHGMSLVWVRLSLLLKGKPDLHTMVCVPTSDDLKLLNEGHVSRGPQEPRHKDHLKSTIKHSKSKSKDTPSITDQTTTMFEKPQSSSPASDFVLGVWPNPLPSVTSHCSRVTLGWVTQADFSLSAGSGEALGFVSVTGLIQTLISQPLEHRGIVLLRNTKSLQYRFAKINIEV
ncbi:ribonucleases P/MRP protein subunit POP1 isoform X2 [Syngnathoides biaculeatus]|uniref:ribonucleases P/MRP protein subunit POP1 isoform X2 n=1 Tax=Syngnathoides biaculeatus TaxID=300417 RepID=UPI002ADD6A92|nr:ribonucleases P/MRP protein subunit POP1 isoform X2 [Syngnathoides biaculeatus]